MPVYAGMSMLAGELYADGVSAPKLRFRDQKIGVQPFFQQPQVMPELHAGMHGH